MTLRKSGQALGYAGLLPFTGLTIITWSGGDWAGYAHDVLLAYAAVILSFMGAIHWGVAMSSGHEHAARQMGLSVLPPLLGWVGLMLPNLYGYSLMILSFIALCAYDKIIDSRALFPAWYLPMRIILTSIVVICLSLAATALVMR